MENGADNTIKYHTQDNSDVKGSSISAAHNHYAKGNYREALNLLLGMLHTTTDSDIYIDVGNCYYTMNAQKEALEYWNKAINLNSKNSKAKAKYSQCEKSEAGYDD